MNKENRIPVKYGVLEVKEKGGYDERFSDITRGFIVSKCYVIESSVMYIMNGSLKVHHEVVFPYKDLKSFRETHRISSNDVLLHLSSLEYSKNHYDLDEVDELFDTYEEAAQLAEQKNGEMEEGLPDLIPIFKDSYGHEIVSDEEWQENLDKLRVQFKENLAICQEFEKMIAVAMMKVPISTNQLVKKDKDGKSLSLYPVKNVSGYIE